jgi:cell wall-associated NlpC family hydrolase
MRWGWVIVAGCGTACASTGAVPRPFPGAPRPARVAPALPPGEHAQNGFDSYALVGTALGLRGAPYRNGGADPRGFDCSGFTQYVFGQYGVPLARDVREQFQQGAAVQPEDISPGDLVFFSTTDPGASHVAIVIGSDQFVHAPSSQGVVRVERLSSSYWSRRYVGARRLN